MNRSLNTLACVALVVGVGIFVFYLTAWQIDGGTLSAIQRPTRPDGSSLHLDGGWTGVSRYMMTAASMVITASILWIRQSR